jgi:hypothetical protein
MQRKAFSCFLALLLVTAQVDDLWVGFMPRPAEDSPAGDDGDYLPPARQERGAHSQNRGTLPLTRPAPALSFLPLTRPSAEVPRALSEVRPGPCLYLFMALLR